MREMEGSARRVIAPSSSKPKKRPNAFLVWVDNVLRRGIDIFFAGLAIILLSPFYLLIAFLIKRDSPGPVLYRGDRMGKGGKTFKILKFRTMYENDHSYQGPRVTAQDDPRITPTGRWLRDTKINELPQLWNVLKGDMSLVGPRPEDPTIASRWPETVAKEILSVKPGLTSPASVLYRHEEQLLQSKSVMDKYLVEILPTKLRLDYLYVRNRSVLTDLDVIFWTVVVLLPRLNNFTVPEYLLYWGPLSRFTARYLTWFFADLVVSFGAVGLAGGIWRLSAPLDLGWDNAVLVALVIAILFSLVNYLMGLNNVDWTKTSMGGALDLAVSSGIVTMVLFVVNLMLANGPLLPPAMLVVSGMLAFFGFAFIRYRSRVLTAFASRWIRMRTGRLNVLGEHVLIVGAGEVGQFAAWLLNNGDLARAFSIVGYVDDDPRRLGMQIDGVKVIGTTDAIPDLIEKHDVGLVMFAIANINPDDQERIMRKCQASNARLVIVPDLLDSMRAHFPASEADRFDQFSRVLRNTTLDKLTGVYNRENFLKLVGQEIPRARRYGHPLTVLYLMIDSPSSDTVLNNSAVAAQVLKEVTTRVRASIREIDIIGRVGEFEFAVLLPETELIYGQMVSDRLIAQIEGSPVWTEHGEVPVQVQSGMAVSDDSVPDAQTLLERARQSLQLAIKVKVEEKVNR